MLLAKAHCACASNGANSEEGSGHCYSCCTGPQLICLCSNGLMLAKEKVAGEVATKLVMPLYALVPLTMGRAQLVTTAPGARR